MAADKNHKKSSTSKTKSKSAKVPNRSGFDRNYFTLPHPFWMLIITFGIWLLLASTFAPDTIPDILGPIATFGKYMSQYHNLNILLCYITVILHCLEAAYAGKVCYDRDMTTSATVKWVASTFLFGFSSLALRLLPYKPGRKTV
ncbi:unnamed protein product [Lymnaea stagnalis]|uniref:Transmembrane protein 254 n=1 Tax=Lymnaea stagnalis TaxID=6523 RepID=A0AAV2IHJ6_LYMST